MKKAFIYFSIIVGVVVIVYAALFIIFIYEGSKVNEIVDVDFNANVKVNLNTNQPVNMKYCVKAEDCQSVGCKCTCSGCGGFSYEDVVNKENVSYWYADNDCELPTDCTENCCPKREIICEENTCKVKTETPDEE